MHYPKEARSKAGDNDALPAGPKSALVYDSSAQNGSRVINDSVALGASRGTVINIASAKDFQGDHVDHSSGQLGALNYKGTSLGQIDLASIELHDAKEIHQMVREHQNSLHQRFKSAGGWEGTWVPQEQYLLNESWAGSDFYLQCDLNGESGYARVDELSWPELHELRNFVLEMNHSGAMREHVQEARASFESRIRNANPGLHLAFEESALGDYYTAYEVGDRTRRIRAQHHVPIEH